MTTQRRCPGCGTFYEKGEGACPFCGHPPAEFNKSLRLGQLNSHLLDLKRSAVSEGR